MSLSDEEIYRQVVDNCGNIKLPAAAVKGYIKKCLSGNVELIRVDAKQDNLSHHEAFQLLHDVIVFTSVCIAVYRPGTRKIGKKEGDARASDSLTLEQKSKIEQLIRELIKDTGK